MYTFKMINLFLSRLLKFIVFKLVFRSGAHDMKFSKFTNWIKWLDILLITMAMPRSLNSNDLKKNTKNYCLGFVLYEYVDRQKE